MSNLNERLKKILWATIQSHIDLNIPIGSILISRRFPVGLSPATIRSTMARLEELGYIMQPHTSAGRVPTEKGYRFYVNTLLEEKMPSINTTLSNELSVRFRFIEKDSTLLIKEAAKTLSSFSSYLALATPPQLENIVFERIKFIKYEKKKVLTVLISEENVVNHKIIELDKAYSQKQLDNAADYINKSFNGLTIKKVKEKITYQLYKEKTICNELTSNLLYLCKDIIPSESDNIFMNEFSGASNLPDFATMKQIKGILRVIEEKRFMLKLLNQVSDSQGTRVLVGMEDIIPAMKDFSMVVSTYNDNKLASGAVGIIGPTRMNYKKLIPVVDHTAKALTKILSNTR